MKISYKFYKNINKIKIYWETFFKYTNNPLLDFQFVKSFNRSLKQRKNALIKHAKIRYLVISKNNEIKIILPVLRKKNNIIESCYLLDYYDILFDIKMKDSEIYNIFQILSNNYNLKFNFAAVNQSSVLYRIFKDKVDLKEKETCSLLDFKNGFEEYFGTLSKSTRQNIRTAYNRLNTDNNKFNLVRIDSNNYKQYEKILKNLYVERRKNRYKNINFILSLLYKFKEPIFDSLKNMQNFSGYILLINNNVSAFMFGLHVKNLLYVPRLVVNEEYSRYSPGILLIIESIKEMIDNKNYYIDLSTGAENYKKSLSGKLHFNYKLEL